MPRSTEYYIPGVLPPKEPTLNIDFRGILSTFDPSTLSPAALAEFSRRDQFITSTSSDGYYTFQGEVRPIPWFTTAHRLSLAKIGLKTDMEELERALARVDTPNGYRAARRCLIKSLGDKARIYLVQKEYDSLTPAQREQQKEDYQRYEAFIKWERENRKASELSWAGRPAPGDLSLKVIAVRKRTLNGARPFTQRDFAKLIGYPVNKYVDAERDERTIEYTLLEKLIMICHANPYYLLDDECDSFLGDSEGVEMGDAPRVIVGMDVIYRWVNAGKPRRTMWEDGIQSSDRITED